MLNAQLLSTLRVPIHTKSYLKLQIVNNEQKTCKYLGIQSVMTHISLLFDLHMFTVIHISNTQSLSVTLTQQ